jgi:hypothetical protein
MLYKYLRAKVTVKPDDTDVLEIYFVYIKPYIIENKIKDIYLKYYFYMQTNDKDI